MYTYYVLVGSVKHGPYFRLAVAQFVAANYMGSVIVTELEEEVV